LIVINNLAFQPACCY